MPSKAPPFLLELRAQGFRSLRAMTLPLGALTVLVGPNGAGKSNVLDLIRFLGDSVRDDLDGALAVRGGFDRVAFRGSSTKRRVTIGVTAAVTKNSSLRATDNYDLELRQLRANTRTYIARKETFVFKRTSGPGRRITLQGADLTVLTGETHEKTLAVSKETLGLATIPRLGPDSGGDQVRAIAELFASFRVFDVDVTSARRPSPTPIAETLASDGSNLAAFLAFLAETHPLRFAELVEDARAFLPGLDDLVFDQTAGPTVGVRVLVRERGLRDATELADVSFGTIRGLALLALLHDPTPPRLTCVEEIDHGLHPYAIDVLVDRLRDATKSSQFIVTTHSPTLVNRLLPSELVVCERQDDGASLIPAISSEAVSAADAAAESELALGELWFSGVLGGVPQ